MQIGSLTLRKLRDLEKESGMTGSKDGGSKKEAPADEVRASAAPWDLETRLTFVAHIANVMAASAQEARCESISLHCDL